MALHIRSVQAPSRPLWLATGRPVQPRRYRLPRGAVVAAASPVEVVYALSCYQSRPFLRGIVSLPQYGEQDYMWRSCHIRWGRRCSRSAYSRRRVSRAATLPVYAANAEPLPFLQPFASLCFHAGIEKFRGQQNSGRHAWRPVFSSVTPVGTDCGRRYARRHRRPPCFNAA